MVTRDKADCEILFSPVKAERNQLVPGKCDSIIVAKYQYEGSGCGPEAAGWLSSPGQ